jgi:general secretion pathway protein G
MKRANGAIRKGFTLIEILVVVVILAILAAVVVPNVINRISDAKNAAAISDIKTFDTDISLYQLDTGSLPPTLQALITNPGVPKWNGPYIKNADKVPLDPWSHPYIYVTPGANGRDFDITSAGPDGQPNTADDVQSWNLKKDQ